MPELRFWRQDRSEQLVRVPLPCPVTRCRLESHPRRVIYQAVTGEPAVIWDCNRHTIFSCSVQDWRPTPNPNVRMS